MGVTIDDFGIYSEQYKVLFTWQFSLPSVHRVETAGTEFIVWGSHSIKKGHSDLAAILNIFLRITLSNHNLIHSSEN